MTDIVTVGSPTAEEYDIEMTYYINKSEASYVASIQQNVTDAIAEYVKWQAGKIGRDINPNKLVELCMAAGAKRVTVTKPVFTTVANTKIATLDQSTVSYGGLEDD